MLCFWQHWRGHWSGNRLSKFRPVQNIRWCFYGRSHAWSKVYHI